MVLFSKTWEFSAFDKPSSQDHVDYFCSRVFPLGRLTGAEIDCWNSVIFNVSEFSV
jgi:hypothetical protein